MTGPRFQAYRDRRGGWRWRLVARNGKIVADSGEAYASMRNVRRALDSVARITKAMWGVPRVQWLGANSATARRR
jgi:uncharacterized protein YegP (UPF0339 family)